MSALAATIRESLFERAEQSRLTVYRSVIRSHDRKG
jgi:hypothetical protein